MVKLTLEMSEHEIELFFHCIESAIDIKEMSEKERNTARNILKQLQKYILNPKVWKNITYKAYFMKEIIDNPYFYYFRFWKIHLVF